MHAFNKLTIGLLLFLTSCNVSLPKRKQIENIIPPPCLEESIDKSLQNPFFAVGNWPEENWWEVFNSPQLDCLISMALQESPSMQQAEARVEYAVQESIIERARLYPLIDFDAKDTHVYLSKNGLYRAFNPKLPLTGNDYKLGFTLKYDFDFWGKNRNLFLASIGRELVQIAELAEVRLILTTAVAQAYISLKTSLIKKKLLEQLYEVNYKVFNLQNLLLKSALSFQLPLLILKENYIETKKQIYLVDQQIAVGKHQINFLMGRGPDEPIEVDDILPPLPESILIPCNLSLDLLSKRPDLMAEIWRAKALAYEVGAAMADFLPDINLTAIVGLESLSLSKLLSSASKTATIIPAFHLPFFTAGAIRANVSAHKAEFDQAIFAYNNLVLKSAQEVVDLLVVGETIYKQKQEQDIIVQFAEERYKIAILRRNKGLSNLFDEYNVNAELVLKEIENIDLLYSQYLVVIQLIKALGGGYDSEFCVPLRACGGCE